MDWDREGGDSGPRDGNPSFVDWQIWSPETTLRETISQNLVAKFARRRR
jgi:hypothetical protein